MKITKEFNNKSTRKQAANVDYVRTQHRCFSNLAQKLCKQLHFFHFGFTGHVETHENEAVVGRCAARQRRDEASSNERRKKPSDGNHIRNTISFHVNIAPCVFHSNVDCYMQLKTWLRHSKL